jgi:Activator of Hsp90 ATPase homolog 1-like protein
VNKNKKEDNITRFEKMNIGAVSGDRKTFNKSVHIDAPPSKVWQMLTTPELMKKWMMPDIELNIITDWKVGNPVTIRGNINGKDF